MRKPWASLGSKISVAALAVSIAVPVTAQNALRSSPEEDFRSFSRTSKNYRETTRDIMALPPWHQYHSIIWPIYYGTQDVQVINSDTVKCARCNPNRVADAISRVRQACEGSPGVIEEAPITTASGATDPKTNKPILKDTFWRKFAYRCKTNPLALNNAFHQESRLTITKATSTATKQLIGKRCTFYSDANGFRFDLAENVISVPWNSESSYVSTKEFVDLPHRSEFWYRPMGRYLTKAQEMSDVFLSQEQLYIAKPFTYSNSLPETLDYIYIRSKSGEFINLQFEQNALISISGYLPTSDTLFQCDSVIDKNDFSGISKFKRID